MPDQPLRTKTTSIDSRSQENNGSQESSFDLDSYPKLTVGDMILLLEQLEFESDQLARKSLDSNSYPKQLHQLLEYIQGVLVGESTYTKELENFIQAVLVGERAHPKEFQSIIRDKLGQERAHMKELRRVVRDKLVRERVDEEFAFIEAKLRQEMDTLIDIGQDVPIETTGRGSGTVTTDSSNANILSQRREGVCLGSKEYVGFPFSNHYEEQLSSMDIYDQFLYLRNLLRNSPYTSFCYHRNIPCIDVYDQIGGSVKVSFSNIVPNKHVERSISAEVVSKIEKQFSCSSDGSPAEIVAKCLFGESACAYSGDDEDTSLFDESACAYSGDDEETPKLERGHHHNNYHKKFGHYPTYRIRVNGVTWRRVNSSDEEADDENSSQELYRASKKQKKASKARLKNLRNGSPRSSGDEGSCDDSGQELVTVCAKKLFKALAKQDVAIDSTSSDASDTESLTDYDT